MMDSMGIFPDFETEISTDRLQCQVVIFVKSVQRAVALDTLLVRDPVGRSERKHDISKQEELCEVMEMGEELY